MELMSSNKVAQKIYNEFSEIIKGKKVNADIAKECALLAIKIVRDSNPHFFDFKTAINSKGKEYQFLETTESAQEFWRDIELEINDIHLN